MKFNVLIAFCVIMITIQVHGQKGFRLGVGTNVLTGNTDNFQIFDEFPEDVTLKTPIALSLIAEYGISDRLMIRSGMEYRFQNIKITEFEYFRAEFVSIPILVDYQLYRNEEKRYSFGLSGGVSLDKIGNNGAYFGHSTQTLGTIEMESTTISAEPTKVLDFKEVSGRFGLNFKKELGDRHQVSLFVMYYTPLRKNSFPVYAHQERIVLSPPNVFIISDTKDSFNLLKKGLLIGVYYTFGPLK